MSREVAAGPRFLKCYDEALFVVQRERVAAGPRFLKCYDPSIGRHMRSPVAAGPRFLKCYDIDDIVAEAAEVAAGPRFMKCYDALKAEFRRFTLQAESDFCNPLNSGGLTPSHYTIQLVREL